MRVSKETRGKLLFAQFNRLFEPVNRIKNFTPDFENTKLVESVIHTEDGRLLMFSGLFAAPGGINLLPFSLGFTLRGMDGVDTGIGSFAFTPGKLHGGELKQASVMAYLSLLDYLVDTGRLNTPLNSIILLFTKNGSFAWRTHACNQYEPFKAAAMKALPYDMEMEFMEAAAA